MHMWHHVTNHLIISNDKDSNSENRIKLRVRDIDDRSVADDRTPQQRANNWLTSVADEHDDVKDIVMQELWGKEDFQNA
jgi:hypothetical protein